MTTRAIEVRHPRPATTSNRLVELLARTPVHIALIGIALLWMIPSIGLLITSFRSRPDIASSG